MESEHLRNLSVAETLVNGHFAGIERRRIESLYRGKIPIAELFSDMYSAVDAETEPLSQS